MISHGKEVKVFTANANHPFAEGICRELGKKLGNSEVTQFADGEVSCSINETVRGCDVFVVQSTCKPVNDHLMELLVMIDAFKRASAGRITAVIPYYGYARQDRKAKARDRCLQARLCRPDYRCHPLLRLCPPGPQGQGPRSHLRKACGKPHHRRRRRPGADHGSALGADSGFLRHSCGQPAGQPCLRKVLSGKIPGRKAREYGGRLPRCGLCGPRPPKRWA